MNVQTQFSIPALEMAERVLTELVDHVKQVGGQRNVVSITLDDNEAHMLEIALMVAPDEALREFASWGLKKAGRLHE